MPARPRLIALLLALAVTVLAGCSDGSAAADREPGDPVTSEEADTLAGLLHRNVTEGGADVTVTAPYAEGAVLTLTGEVDFASGTGRAQAVTTGSTGQATESRTLFFTDTDLWYGDVPGLTEALAAAGRPGATYLERPLSPLQAGGTASLVDVLVQLVLNLAAPADDDPRAILERGYTWQGQRTVDGQLASVYRTGSGATVVVSAEDELLLQYVTRLPDQTFDVTITLGDHGSRTITLPDDAETALVADYPQIADELGF
ncbi:hypothetical protein TEK04_07820 [Klenkia sp. LSe6-5]|uniref:Lipoprotein LprG n=1 Tax=Klenkia sesuvii TaxID=3103137 RepID=A0ABU8DS51_9ACTN